MSDTEVLAGVLSMLDERRPAEETIRAIRRLLEPAPEPQPIERNSRGWPLLRASTLPAPTWSHHDDPETP